MVEMRFAQVREFDALLAEPGIERCRAPRLGAHADDGVTLIDQLCDECFEVRRQGAGRGSRECHRAFEGRFQDALLAGGMPGKEDCYVQRR